EMRQYSPGDPPRLILWKVYARTRKLMVRVSERAIIVQPRTCSYLVAGTGDDAVASLARSVLERELLGQGWRFGADGSPKPTSDLGEALRALARSGNPPNVPTGLAGFLQGAAADGYKSCLVFVPPTAGPWLPQVAAVAARSPLRLTFVTSGVHGAARPLWAGLLLRPEGQVALSDQVLGALEDHPVLTFDPQHGTVRREPARRPRKAAAP
ncbi:MAG: DUF58 domain-containing protein, partial [Candidatus Eremiobacterota bacterium]